MSVSFDKKLAELDAYLQMLISENEALDKKLLDYNRSSNTSINSYESGKEGILNIKNNLEKLLSSIKHAIVLLQIAKVSSRSSCSNSLGSGASGSTTDLRSSNVPQTPPTRPSRSSRLTPSSSSCGSSSKESSTKLANCAESSNKSSAIGGRHIYDSNSQLEQQSLQQDQLLAGVGTAAHTVLAAKPQPDHTLSHHQQTLSPSSSLPQSSQLHDTAALAGAEAIPSRTVPTGLACSNNNNSYEVEATAIVSCNIEDEEDDDAFFDADDEQHNQTKSNSSRPLDSNTSHPSISQPSLINATAAADAVTTETTTTRLDIQHQVVETQRRTMSETNNNVDSRTSIDDGSIDWDAMYEEEDEDELGSMEGQGSVIKHLLSQIRIGMDLTKVVLPTFILERRSLLEMYADFFAHPDLFSTIPDFSTPEERMIQLVRWYLSAFHAGRKSSLAKKPYNPILGEIFQCKWELPGDGITPSTSNNDKDNKNQPIDKQEQEQNLTFVAEQVSHHPPVSAFYAENKEKSISCCAHIYTKSKYLGLSVGVHNIGQGVINLIKHNETYTCTFPSAYGRSILTVPWVELGGPVTIVCEQTGYKANIEFVMKPFYGGKKHRVTGEILRPSTEPILTIEGEWNGIMYSKSPPNTNEKEIFVDTTNLPVIKKHVNPVTTQESFESRNVWKEVTRALKLKDVNSATAAKSYIEQRQRDQLKERLEHGAKWNTRFFEAAGDSWTFRSAASTV